MGFQPPIRVVLSRSVTNIDTLVLAPCKSFNHPKCMKSLILSLTIILFSPLAEANWGLYGGLNATTFKAEKPIAGFDFQTTIGASFGLTGLIELDHLPILIRTGVGIATRGAEVDIGTSSTAKNTVITLEGPATVLYEFNPTFGIYGGLNFLYQLDAGCDPDDGYCSEGSVKFFQELVAGTRVNVSFSHSLELEYATLLNRLENDVIWNAITLRYLYWFD